MWTQAFFRANAMILDRWHTPPPRGRYLRSTFAFVAFLCVLLSCLTLFGAGDYSPLEHISVITSVDASFRLPPFQSYRTKPNSVFITGKNDSENNFVNLSVNTNGNRTLTPKMCTDIFSIRKTRSAMKPFTKSIISHIRRVKFGRKSRHFLRHEPYILLGDMMPVMINSSTTRTNNTKVNFNKVWRMEQVAGLFPHLSCRLRDYSTAMLKQCLVNRHRRGKGTKLLFMGDSRVRQYVEVFLDVFRDMEFEITTHEGIIISVDEFLSLDASILWAKYKKTFAARSRLVENIEIEFYWTKIFNLKVKNVRITSESQNTNVSAVLEFLKAEDIAKGIGNATHALYHMELKKMRKDTSIPSETNSSLPGNFLSTYTTGKSFMNRTSKEINNGHPEQSNTDSSENLKATIGIDVSGNIPKSHDDVRPIKETSFNSEPLKKLEKLLSLTSTEVPDIVILGSNLWGVDNAEPILRVLDEVTLRQVAQLRPLLLRLRTVTQLVWVMPTPVKDHMYQANSPMAHYTNVFMRNIEWIASAQVQLMARGITVWDSFFPIALASINDCVQAYLHGDVALPPHPRFGFIKSWVCGDRIHNNNEAVLEAVQMVVNQLCNEYMPHEGYCCEE